MVSFVRFEAGTDRSDCPHPDVLELLETKGHYIDKLVSKSVDVFTTDDAPEMDIVFTVCDHAANEECPSWHGFPMNAHWGLPNPISNNRSAVEAQQDIEQVYDLLVARIQAFAALPLDQIDGSTLQQHLDGLGRKSSS